MDSVLAGCGHTHTQNKVSSKIMDFSKLFLLLLFSFSEKLIKLNKS